MKGKIYVTLKQGVLDPQGKAVAHGLASLGYDNVQGVRQGKVFEVALDEDDPAQARERLEEMSQRLLANTVIEDYTIELEQ